MTEKYSKMLQRQMRIARKLVEDVKSDLGEKEMSDNDSFEVDELVNEVNNSPGISLDDLQNQVNIDNPVNKVNFSRIAVGGHKGCKVIVHLYPDSEEWKIEVTAKDQVSLGNGDLYTDSATTTWGFQAAGDAVLEFNMLLDEHDLTEVTNPDMEHVEIGEEENSNGS